VIEVRHTTPATAEAVWNVLADGWLYPSWVVGAARMRAVDAGWPGVGTQLHHSVGTWPLLLNDTTRVLASRPARELVLRARAWPVGEAKVEIVLEPAGGGCEIVMREDAVSGPGTLLPRSVRAALIEPRNTETLTRLAYLAEGSSR
jgi:Polyketide cyclase / dehydrase and lipid transport